MSTRMADQTWLQRNTRWIVLGAIVIGLSLVAAFIGGILIVASIAIRSSDVFVTAVSRAQVDQRVIALLGEPVEAGLLVSGSISVEGNDGTAELAIPLDGPRGDASLTVAAIKREGQWHFTEMLVTPLELSSQIDLLPPEERAATGPSQQ